MMPAQETIAGSLGYISIACWLCAQLPYVPSYAFSSPHEPFYSLETQRTMLMYRQVVKNVSLQSCEGLSLPFLINWLFGMSPLFIIVMMKLIYRGFDKSNRMCPN